MACTNPQKVLFGPHVLSEWENTLQRLEVVDTIITWEIFKKDFLDKYFPVDVRNHKEIDFLELK